MTPQEVGFVYGCWGAHADAEPRNEYTLFASNHWQAGSNVCLDLGNQPANNPTGRSSQSGSEC